MKRKMAIETIGVIGPFAVTEEIHFDIPAPVTDDAMMNPKNQIASLM
jgi:hypothetical protein